MRSARARVSIAVIGDAPSWSHATALEGPVLAALAVALRLCSRQGSRQSGRPRGRRAIG
jgi:hypothetical protein